MRSIWEQAGWAAVSDISPAKRGGRDEGFCQKVLCAQAGDGAQPVARGDGHAGDGGARRAAEALLEELRAYGIIPFEQKALPRYEGPKIEFDAKDVSDDDVAGWDGPRSRFRGRREADHGCSSTRQLLLVSAANSAEHEDQLVD
jgi:hypothetical protein